MHSYTRIPGKPWFLWDNSSVARIVGRYVGVQYIFDIIFYNVIWVCDSEILRFG